MASASAKMLSLAAVLAVASNMFAADAHSIPLRKIRNAEASSSGADISARKLTTCGSSMSWKSSDGKLVLNDKPFHLKGANWFGFETELSVVHGIWGAASTTDKILDFCNDNKINALRIPISLDLALQPDTISGSCVECNGAKSWDVLNKLIDKAASKGILILLDMHRLNRSVLPELWYDEQHTEADFIQGWINLLEKFGNKPNLIGIDVKNEPHGSASWGMGNAATDWNSAAERIVKAITTKIPSYNKLIFIEGVGSGNVPQGLSTTDDAYWHWWGGNMYGIKSHPIDFGSDELNDLIVYSPHTYGPGVNGQPYFNVPNFPSNMPDIWNKQIGWVKRETGKAVVVGEWGGTYEGQDKKWQDTFALWSKENCMSDAFYWSINPNSGDTGGLLKDDWLTPRIDKLAVMSVMQPNPSVFTTPITDTNHCIDYGAFANSACQGTGSGPVTPTVPAPVPVTPTVPAPVPVEPIVPAPTTPEPTVSEPTTPEPTVPAPVPAMPTSAGGVALAWNQCGGKVYNGAVDCITGYVCKEINEWYSQCVPGPVVVSSACPNGEWAQCNGRNYEGNNCCTAGTQCIFISEYYSQCQAITTSAAASGDQTESESANNIPTDDIQTEASYHVKSAKTVMSNEALLPIGTTTDDTTSVEFQTTVITENANVNSTMPILITSVPVVPSTVDLYRQCGGVNWKGAKKCTPGNDCVKINKYYSQCRRAKPSVDNKCNSDYKQCGGKKWKGPKCCLKGAECVISDVSYSQCRPIRDTNQNTINTLKIPTATSTTTTTTTENDNEFGIEEYPEENYEEVSEEMTEEGSEETVEETSEETTEVGSEEGSEELSEEGSEEGVEEVSEEGSEEGSEEMNFPTDTDCAELWQSCSGGEKPSCCKSGSVCAKELDTDEDSAVICLPYRWKDPKYHGSNSMNTDGELIDDTAGIIPVTETDTDQTSTDTKADTNNDMEIVQLWAQCGGLMYIGSEICQEGSFCKMYNVEYSQCIPQMTTGP